MMDVIGRSNAFGLRSMIVRERGIAAYRAWPADDRPPHRPLAQRIMLAAATYALVPARF